MPYDQARRFVFVGVRTIRLAPEWLPIFFLVSGAAVVGRFLLGREPGTGGLAEDVVREAIAFGRVVTPFLRVVQLLGKYRELMIRDDQTQSFNRRYFESFLQEEFIRAKRYGSSLSLIFIDLDNLKRVNELHGHTIGSKAIRKVADRVMPLIRTVDKLFRYGGDERLIFLDCMKRRDWHLKGSG